MRPFGHISNGIVWDEASEVVVLIEWASKAGGLTGSMGGGVGGGRGSGGGGGTSGENPVVTLWLELSQNNYEGLRFRQVTSKLPHRVIRK